MENTRLDPKNRWDIERLLASGGTIGSSVYETLGSATTKTAYTVIDSYSFLELINQNKSLINEIRILGKLLSELVSTIKEKEVSQVEEVVTLREIAREQARKEIEELFGKSDTLYFSDIAEELKLDLELVVELCQELEKEGKIKIKE